MTATDVDEYGRPEPPLAGTEVETLLGFLDHQRATFAWTCAGLDDDLLRTPTATAWDPQHRGAVDPARSGLAARQVTARRRTTRGAPAWSGRPCRFEVSAIKDAATARVTA